MIYFWKLLAIDAFLIVVFVAFLLIMTWTNAYADALYSFSAKPTRAAPPSFGACVIVLRTQSRTVENHYCDLTVGKPVHGTLWIQP